MAKRPNPEPTGSWLLAEELLERGDASFVDELRRINDAERLGAYAARWYADPRPHARRLMFDYLDRPLNAFRHEPLVKRLFKLAEKAGDDALVARFMVAFDRSIRRVRRKVSRYDYRTREYWQEEIIRIPARTTMPKDPNASPFRNPRTGERISAESQGGHKRRLFFVHTRHYLRRRAWRYFRNLGKSQPARYVPAVVEALKAYTDADVEHGLALIDNWGLIHVLFHHSPVLVAKAHGWRLTEGRTLAELAPAPAFEPLWQASAAPLVELLRHAKCRPVRRWAVEMLRKQHPEALGKLSVQDLVALLGHEDAEVASLAAEALRNSPLLGGLGVEQWLTLLDTSNPQTLDLVVDLITKRLDPRAVTLTQAAKLAASRPLPVARLGLAWLKSKRPTTEAEARALLALAEAEAVAVRPELVRWARETLSASPFFQPAWVLEYLDSRHADVREEGWHWFREEPRARDDVTLWQRLLESPYDDLRLRLVAELERLVARRAERSAEHDLLDPELVRYLWAAVLLNVHRGGRSKPVVVGQVVRRLRRRPDEAEALLPILSVALRSIRGPEWRAGLAGVLQLVERRPELLPLVQSVFPELKLDPAGAGA